MAPIGLPAIDTRRQGGVIRIAGARLDRDRGQVTEILRVGQPIHVHQHVVRGGTTSLSDFAVAVAVAISSMFITLLLAALLNAVRRKKDAAKTCFMRTLGALDRAPALARYLQTVIQGMRFVAKTGASESELREVAASALLALGK